ncbi:MAG: iron ABC transporter permease [bacterium]|nr:iron ABC transporter permease [bacterium]
MLNIKWIGLILILLLLVVLDTFCIPTNINPFTDFKLSETILFSIRLPKILTAMAAGIALSAGGLMLQQLFKNPLAGPYVLGVSSGASLAVGMVIIGGASLPFLHIFYFQSISIALAGFIGAFVVLLLALLVSYRFGYSYILLLFGVIIGQILGAFQTLIDYLANPTDLKQFSLWNMGSFYNTINDSLYILVAFVSFGIIWSFRLMKPLSIMILGNDVAYTLGVKTKKVSLQILMCTGLLTGVVTAFCGPIAFIGMAVPNVARMMYKTANFKKLLLFNVLVGAGMALFCDIIGNLPFFNFHLPINVSTALIGGPIVLFILLKRKY